MYPAECSKQHVLFISENDVELINRLAALKKELDAYQVFYCALMHENIVSKSYDSDADSSGNNGFAYKRKGFCDPVTRRKTISCAHSKANTGFSKLALEILSLCGVEASSGHFEKLQSFFLKIYQLDYQKGCIEKDRALAILSKKEQRVIVFDKQLSTIHNRHLEAVKNLEEFKSYLLQCIHDMEQIVANLKNRK